MPSEFVRALHCMHCGRWDLAAKELQAALATQEDDAELHVYLARCWTNLNRHTAAEREVRRALELNPGEPSAQVLLGEILLQQEKHAEAKLVLEAALVEEPYNSRALYLMALLKDAQSDYAAVLELCNQALEIDPDSTPVQLQRARALSKLGQYDRAQVALDIALGESPDDDSVHAQRGWIQLENGHANEAVRHFGEALRINPQCESAQQGLVEALKARNRIYGLILRGHFWLGDWCSRRPALLQGLYWGCIALAVGVLLFPQFALDLGDTRYLFFGMILFMCAPMLFDWTLLTSKLGRRALTPSAKFMAVAAVVLLTGGGAILLYSTQFKDPFAFLLRILAMQCCIHLLTTRELITRTTPNPGQRFWLATAIAVPLALLPLGLFFTSVFGILTLLIHPLIALQMLKWSIWLAPIMLLASHFIVEPLVNRWLPAQAR